MSLKKESVEDRKYHCQGYYNLGVCPSVGKLDPSFVWLKHERFTCTSDGVSPFDGKVCSYCIELRKRRKGISKTSPVKVFKDVTL